MKIIKMDKKIEKEQNRELEQFCRQIREYVQSGRIRECEQLIPQYMQKYPDSAVPHNLLGIVLEMKGCGSNETFPGSNCSGCRFSAGKLQYGAVQFFCEKVYDKTCVWMGRLREERHTSWYKHIRQKK